METFYRLVPTVKRENISLEEFKAKLLADRPREIYNSGYSKEIPVCYITEYLEDGVMTYWHSAADKTPEYKTFEKVYRSFRIQCLEAFYYEKELV